VTAKHTGLTQAEAARRLAEDGPNTLPQERRRTAWRIVGEVLREPMLALLLAGGLAYLLLGDLAEALILLAFATFSVVVTVVQETRTERVLEALRDLSSPRALVIRDGQRLRIAGCDVVRGDLLVLEQGDRVPADAVLLEASDLQADESLLTGESVPVSKRAQPSLAELPAQRPGGDDQPFVYSGSLIARGSGVAEVRATGSRTEIGKIGTSLAALDPEAPRLRRETARIVRLCGAGGAAVALLVVLLFASTRGGWLDAVLAGITTGMAMLPEEFPVVLTIFLAMGAWKIGKAGVLTRRAAAIETLGSTTVLCTDKTGTLTENRMAVVRLWLPSHGEAVLGGGEALPGHFAPILDASVLASAIDAVDPMEVAIHQSTANGLWPVATVSGPNCSPCRTAGRPVSRTSSWWRPRARPRRLPYCAGCPPQNGRRCWRRPTGWRSKASGCWASQPLKQAIRCRRKTTATMPLPSPACSASPTRSAPAFRKPSPIAGAPGSGW
jgi:P-type Ca2+ transporter type 2C